MKRLLLIAFLAVICLGLGLVLSCGGDDDDDDDTGDDDDDDCDIADPMTSAECSSFCNADNCSSGSPAYVCMNPEGYDSVDECISDCMTYCQQGCIPANAQDCIDAFTDCETFYECMGVDIG